MKMPVSVVRLAFLMMMLAMTASASAHSVPWRAGESRQLGYMHCAKGPCMKRTYWGPNKPHRHENGNIVFDRIVTTFR